MKDPIVLHRKDTLSPADAAYLKDLFYRVIKIGTELELAPPRGTSREDFENIVRGALMPSGCLEDLGVNGILDVSPEHCGVEIRIIGRQPHFRSLQRQYATIMKILKQYGARSRPTCGLHFHLLTPTLAEPVPEIVLANLWNLTRRYAPELRFITSCGDSRSALCRRRNHTSHLEMIRHSPATMSMAEIQQILKASSIVPEHQNFLNLEHIGFTGNGAINPYHLEFRFPDMDISPTSVSAKAFLFLAMALKAVDLSQYGVIHVGKVTPWRRKNQILDLLSNNEGNLATSDTSGITDSIIEELRQGCYELLDLLAPAFEWFHNGTYTGSNPALDVLLALAEQPVSLMRCAGYDWEKIEDLLVVRTDLDDGGLDETDRRLMQRVELGEWAGLPSADAWHWLAARELYLTPQELERRLQKLINQRGLRWDARQGTMVFSN
ncbi:MAG: hypothetical protein WBV22_01250 [Anaerolineaceae bacterium]